MNEIQLCDKYSLRGLLAKNDKIYVTDNKRPYISEIDLSTLSVKKYKSPSIIGALTSHGNFIFAASYSACKPHIYKMNDKFSVVDSFNYLFNIPPKYLPNEPYERYCVGICVHLGQIYMTLQNCPYIFILSQKGDFIDVANKNNSDICGIEFYKNDLYYADKSKCAIFKGDALFLQLEKDYHPFDISIDNDKLYIASSTLGKISCLCLTGFAEINTVSIDSDAFNV